MQIELSDKIQSELEQAAAAAGMSPAGYANLLIEEQLARNSRTMEQRSHAIDALIEYMETATAASGREGRRWRAFIHEGHAR